MHRYRCFKNCSIAFAILAVAFSVATIPAFGQVTIDLSGSSRTLPPQNIFGTTASDRNTIPWFQKCTTGPNEGQPVNPGLATAVTGLNYGVLRIPTGTGANFWDWGPNANDPTAGQIIQQYQPLSGGGPNQCSKLSGDAPSTEGLFNCTEGSYPSPYQELETELTTAGAKGDYVLNVVTNPQCVAPEGGYCQYTPPGVDANQSPNESYQQQLLEQLTKDGATVPRVEMGNELYFDSADAADVYGTGTSYADTMLSWMSTFRGDPKISNVSKYGLVIDPCPAFGSCPSTSAPPYGDNGRRANWNSNVMTEVGNWIVNGHTAPDALILHYYDQTEIEDTPPGSTTPVTGANAHTMLLEPFTTWNTKIDPYINSSSGLTSSQWTPNIWYTEYNLHDNCDPVNNGTWAQALYTATQSLLAVSESRVTEALHFEAQAPGVTFPDIFVSNNAFAQYSASGTFPNNIWTNLDGYTGQGLTTQMLDTAAQGEYAAQTLSFSGAPDFAGSTQAAMIGEVFGTSGSKSAQIIILNLSSGSLSVNLSDFVASGTYKQIYGDAGVYVTGFTTSTGYKAVNDQTGDESDLTLATGSSLPASLPQWSITLITATLKNNF